MEETLLVVVVLRVLKFLGNLEEVSFTTFLVAESFVSLDLEAVN